MCFFLHYYLVHFDKLTVAVSQMSTIRSGIKCRQATFGVDHVFNFLEPIRLDIVTNALHSGFDVANPDPILALFVKRFERISGR